LAVASTFAIAQQPGVSLSPFVSFVPEADASPLAGLSLSLTGGPLSLRAGGHLSVRDRAASSGLTTSMRPWGADADAIAYLESYNYNQHVLFTPYVFAGLSATALDSGRYRVMHQGWSYGGGLLAPMGSAFGAFGEMRWRMSQFMLPNAQDALPATREMRLGFSFRVGGGGTPAEIVHVLSATDIGSLSEAAAPTTNRAATRVISTAENYVGVPYRRGGTSPQSGFDASGFVRFVFSMLGVNLPRLSRDQARVGERVRPDLNALSPGDLVMFQDDGGINHVAIYVGRARIIHSSETGGGVREDDLNSDRGRWFLEHLAAARRVLPDARGMLLDLARGFSSDVPYGTDGPDHAPRVPSRRRD
jgi:cell wall-associated NlpC family hydrolase